MRILNVITSVNPAQGGPVEGLTRLVKVLQKEGHEVEVVSLDAPDAPWVRESPLRVHALGPGRGTYGYTPRLVPWLQNNHKQYDAVVVRGIWQYGSYGTWRALRNSDTPYVVFPHGMLDPWFKKTYPLKHLKKVLYWLAAESRALRDARAVCFTCDEERILARQSFNPYTVNERVVNYGTAWPEGDAAAQREIFLEEFPHLRGKRIVLFLSRIHEKKGCDLLIEAFATRAQEYNDLHLVIAGPDQTGWVEDLKALAQKRGIADRVTWPGMLQGDRKWGAYHAAEVFMLPSHQENFGIVVAEALACSVPVLISDKVNIWREIETDRCGLVGPDTVAGTVDLLTRWLALPGEERLQMGRNARDSFARRFEVHEAARSLLGVLTSLEPAQKF